jgi:hypothetical protein
MPFGHEVEASRRIAPDPCGIDEPKVGDVENDLVCAVHVCFSQPKKVIGGVNIELTVDKHTVIYRHHLDGHRQYPSA